MERKESAERWGGGERGDPSTIAWALMCHHLGYYLINNPLSHLTLVGYSQEIAAPQRPPTLNQESGLPQRMLMVVVGFVRDL